MDGLAEVTRAVGAAFADKMPSFAGARYVRGDGIGDHDDRAAVPVATGPDGADYFSRDVAAVYYLCKKWRYELQTLNPKGHHIP